MQSFLIGWNCDLQDETRCPKPPTCAELKDWVDAGRPSDGIPPGLGETWFFIEIPWRALGGDPLNPHEFTIDPCVSGINGDELCRQSKRWQVGQCNPFACCEGIAVCSVMICKDGATQPPTVKVKIVASTCPTFPSRC